MRDPDVDRLKRRTLAIVVPGLKRVSLRLVRAVLPLFLLTAGAMALSQQVDLGSGSVIAAAERLKTGQYVWAPQLAPGGPMLLIVNVRRQRALLYRNGLPIAAATVSTGRPGYGTPTGVFTILQKHIEHYSSKYDSAPMPYMQRLTWYGIALHAGHLPGYPASHGCIRLPHGFAKLLYGATRLGMTVVITDDAAMPRLASPPGIADPVRVSGENFKGPTIWQPERSANGPVSIIVSVSDQRAIVLRNGVQIGSAEVAVSGPVTGSWAYSLRSVDAAGQHWMRVPLSADAADNEAVPREEWQRFKAPDEFRRAVAKIVEPGTTVIVTPESLASGSAGHRLTVIEGTPEKR